MYVVFFTDPQRLRVFVFQVMSRGAPDLEFSNPAGTGFTGFGQKFRPDLPDLKQDILG